MRIIASNCQGLGNRPTVHSLLQVQKHSNPDVMFLSETHLDLYPAECLRKRLKMDFKIVNPSSNRCGGVMLLWRRGIDIHLIFSLPNYIDVSIQESVDKVWRLTGIYGEPHWEDKYKTWNGIRHLHAQSSLPWVLIGDFNEILYSHEKEGGNPRPQQFMQAFRDVLYDCNLEDLGFSGDKFTWRGGRICERLNRALANDAWLAMHPHASLHHLDSMRSDHRSILLETEVQPEVTTKGSPKFQAKWLREESFHTVVEQSLGQGGCGDI
jgi:hypothetical protein